eukprot:10458687-Alexandrium_andersonii.AAC.1
MRPALQSSGRNYGLTTAHNSRAQFKTTKDCPSQIQSNVAIAVCVCVWPVACGLWSLVCGLRFAVCDLWCAVIGA